MVARFERRQTRVLLAETRKKPPDDDELRWIVTEETFIASDDGRAVVRKIWRQPGIVVIVPFLGPDRIVLLRQFRFAVGHDDLWELPAGTLDATIEAGSVRVRETAEACAARELVEEAGYRAATVREVANVYTMPGTSDQTVAVCFATGLTACPPRPDADELITEVRAFPTSELREMIATRVIRDAKSLVGLLYALAESRTT